MVELGEAVFAAGGVVALFVEMGMQLPEGGLDLGKLGANVLPCLLKGLLGLGDVGVLASPKLVTLVFRLP